MTSVDSLLALFLRHRRVCTDTRQLRPGDLYWALKGARFDGNQFALQALEQGAAWAVVDDASLYGQDHRLTLVPDGLEALQELAEAFRATWTIPVIGLTGSNGKTTSKELIAAALRGRYRVHATAGNLNNHIGVPLTVLACPPDAEIAIVEMGTNQPGDIRQLADFAKPQAGLITNIGYAHIEKLLSLDGVQHEKGQLFHVVKEQAGQLFVNADDPRVLAEAGDYPQVSSFGLQQGQVRAEILSQSTEGMTLLVHHPGWQQPLEIRSALSGPHNALNIAAACLVASHFGVEPPDIARGIGAYLPANHRSQLIQREGYAIWMDAYNANPSSMRAAIQHVMSLGMAKVGLILGDMYELGADSEQHHRELGQFIEQLRPALVVGVGKDIRHTLGEVSVANHHFSTAQEAASALPGLITGCDLLLIKASRGIGLEKVLETL